jgi:hypothetical protein
VLTARTAAANVILPETLGKCKRERMSATPADKLTWEKRRT